MKNPDVRSLSSRLASSRHNPDPSRAAALLVQQSMAEWGERPFVDVALEVTQQPELVLAALRDGILDACRSDALESGAPYLVRSALSKIASTSFHYRLLGMRLSIFLLKEARNDMDVELAKAGLARFGMGRSDLGGSSSAGLYGRGLFSTLRAEQLIQEDQFDVAAQIALEACQTLDQVGSNLGNPVDLQIDNQYWCGVLLRCGRHEEVLARAGVSIPLLESTLRGEGWWATPVDSIEDLDGYGSASDLKLQLCLAEFQSISGEANLRLARFEQAERELGAALESYEQAANLNASYRDLMTDVKCLLEQASAREATSRQSTERPARGWGLDAVRSRSQFLRELAVGGATTESEFQSELLKKHDAGDIQASQFLLLALTTQAESKLRENEVEAALAVTEQVRAIADVAQRFATTPAQRARIAACAIQAETLAASALLMTGRGEEAALRAESAASLATGLSSTELLLGKQTESILLLVQARAELNAGRYLASCGLLEKCLDGPGGSRLLATDNLQQCVTELLLRITDDAKQVSQLTDGLLERSTALGRACIDTATHSTTRVWLLSGLAYAEFLQRDSAQCSKVLRALCAQLEMTASDGESTVPLIRALTTAVRAGDLESARTLAPTAEASFLAWPESKPDVRAQVGFQLLAGFAALWNDSRTTRVAKLAQQELVAAIGRANNETEWSTPARGCALIVNTLLSATAYPELVQFAIEFVQVSLSFAVASQTVRRELDNLLESLEKRCRDDGQGSAVLGLLSARANLIRDMSDEGNWRRLVAVLGSQASQALEVGEPNVSLTAATEVTALLRARLPSLTNQEESELYALSLCTYLNGVAECNLLLGLPDTALPALDEASELQQAQRDDSTDWTQERIQTLNLRARAHKDLGELDAAAETYLSAHQVGHRQLGDELTRVQLVEVLEALIRIRMAQGDPSRALSDALHRISELEACGYSTQLRRLYDTLIALSDQLAEQDLDVESLRCSEAAIRMLLRAARDNVTVCVESLDLAAREHLPYMEDVQGSEATARFATFVVDEFRELDRLAPGGLGQYMALAFFRCGHYATKIKAWELALQMLNEAVVRGRAAVDETDEASLFYLGRSLGRLGAVFAEMQETEGAVRAFHEAAELLERILHEASPSVVQHVLLVVLTGYAECLDAAGRLDEAARVRERAEGINLSDTEIP